MDKSAESELPKELKKYASLFPKAWSNFLKDVEKGKIFVPSNEAELRCFLFSKCLLVMRRNRFPIPYQITAEDKEILEGRRADLTLGLLEDGRFVTIEIKYFPSVDLIKNDLRKLRDFVKSHVIYGFFAMIGNSKYTYEQKVDLESLGVEKDGKYSFYEWRMIKPPYLEISIDALIVGLMA